MYITSPEGVEAGALGLKFKPCKADRGACAFNLSGFVSAGVVATYGKSLIYHP